MGGTLVAIAERAAELGRVLGVVGQAVGLVVEHLDREAVAQTGKQQDRMGGYFCWTGDTFGAPIIVHAQIGVVRAEKIDKYRAFSHEKPVRLAVRPTDVSSWQSRDEAHDQYGGAIRVMPTLLSFSGLPEAGDEAAMVLAAVKLGLLPLEQIDPIVQPSHNLLFQSIVGRLMSDGCWHEGRWTVPQE